MKKRRIYSFAVVLSLLVSILSLTGCGGSSGEIDTITLKAGFSTSSSDPRVIATQQFKEEVEKATNGRITVEIYSDGELGSDADLISGVINGTVDITASSAGNFASYDPNVGISAFPFLFENFDEAWSFVDGDIEDMAEENLSDFNIHVLGHYDNGFRCVTTSSAAGPVNNVSDMEDLNIRTPENRIVMETMLLLGAQPKVLEFTLLYDALKSGEFDAQENPIPVIYNNKLYEVQSYLAITNHSYDVMPFVIREDIWNKLSDSDKRILEAAADNAENTDRDLIRQQTEDYIGKLREEGMTITYPDLDDFSAATSVIYNSFGDTYSKDLLDIIKNL